METVMRCQNDLAEYMERLEACAAARKVTHKIPMKYIPIFYCINSKIVRMADMVRVCHIQQQSLGKILKDMEDEGLIERMPHGTDKRSYLFEFTADGRRACRALRDADNME